MAFPVIASHEVTIGGDNVTSIDVELPSGMQDGDGLFVLVVADFRKVTEWGPLTSIGEFGDASGYASVGLLMWDGSQSSPITLGMAGSCTPIALTLRLDGSTIESWQIQQPAITGHAIASSTTPQQPLLTVPWGPADNLWLSIYGMVYGQPVDLTGRPAGWTLVDEAEFSTEPYTAFSVSMLEATNGYERPGNYTIDPARKSLGLTVGISPIVGGFEGFGAVNI